MSILNRKIEIHTDRDENIIVDDYYSMMASINNQWFDDDQPAGKGMFDIVCHDYARDFDILHWYMLQEKPEEWQPLPLEYDYLNKHLARLEFWLSLQCVHRQICEAVDSEFVRGMQRCEERNLEMPDVNRGYMKYMEQKPSEDEVWQAMYAENWQSICPEFVGAFRPDFADVLSNDEYHKKVNIAYNTLAMMGLHMRARMQTSFDAISEILSTACPRTEEWQKLFHISFSTYVERNNDRILRELYALADKHKRIFDEATPEIWLKCYDEELARLKEEMPHCTLDVGKTILSIDGKEAVLALINIFNSHISQNITIGIYHYEMLAEVNRMFDAMHRLNLLKCLMMPKLEKIYVKILEPEEDDEQLSDEDEALLERILKYVPRGNWKAPATTEKVTLFVRTVFGADMEHIDAEDVEQTEQVRLFFKKGRTGNSDRVEISWANIVGFFMRYQLLEGGQKEVNKDFFGIKDHVNNINKGKDDEASKDFKAIEPLLEKYRKIILK